MNNEDQRREILSKHYEAGKCGVTEDISRIGKFLALGISRDDIFEVMTDTVKGMGKRHEE